MGFMNTNHDQDPRAIRLAVVVKRLRARLQEITLPEADLSLSQMAIIRRLRLDGPATAASLAAAEHVTHQAITQSLSDLKRAGLVEATPDPLDGRKKLINVTDAGNTLFNSVKVMRNVWLSHAIEAIIDESELPALDKAIELLERLADARNSGNIR
jgi:DNA-binding MarR family transcriptional regulator